MNPHYTKGYIPPYKKVNSKQFAVHEKLQSKSIVSSWYTEQIWWKLKSIALANLVAKNAVEKPVSSSSGSAPIQPASSPWK